MFGFDVSDVPRLVAVFGAVVGMFVHIVKKKTEETGGGDESEVSIFKRWVLHRPFNSFAAAIGAIGVAMALQPQGSLMVVFFNSLVAGFAANSAINRPGEAQ